MTSTCTVKEGGKVRTFEVTIEPSVDAASSPSSPAPAATPSNGGTKIFSGFGGEVEVIDVLVKSGDKVNKGKVVASVEAMKAQHDIKAPCDGTVTSVDVRIGDEIGASQSILTIS